MEVWIGLVSVLVGAVAGALATFITTRNRIDLEQRAKFDYELRGLRLKHYQDLHHVSERLPRQFFSSAEEPTREDLLDLREAFHQWYFGPSAGGMFLTEAARERYFKLMNGLQSMGEPSGDAVVLTADEQQTLRDLAHDLRQQLRADLGTAEAPKSRWTARGLTPAPPPVSPLSEPPG